MIAARVAASCSMPARKLNWSYVHSATEAMSRAAQLVASAMSVSFTRMERLRRAFMSRPPLCVQRGHHPGDLQKLGAEPESGAFRGGEVDLEVDAARVL